MTGAHVPAVLLDRSLLVALVDPAHEQRPAAVETYRSLLDRYERGEVLLRSRHDHLDGLVPLAGSDVGRTLLAPIERLHVAAQHRRAAGRLALPADVAVDDDVAVTLVVLRRERIRHVAALDPVFRRFDLDVVP